MTTFPTPQEQRFDDMLRRLQQRVQTLESQMAAGVGAYAAQPLTSASRPVSPVTGSEIFETDTGALAVYSGSAWLYGVQQVAEVKVTGSVQATIVLPVAGSFASLLCCWVARADPAALSESMVGQLNGDTGSNYLWQQVENGVSTNSGTATAGIHLGQMPAGTASASFPGHGSFTVSTPQSTAFFKVLRGTAAMNTSTSAWSIGDYGGTWSSTAAVSSITLRPGAGNFAIGTVATLYGIP